MNKAICHMIRLEGYTLIVLAIAEMVFPATQETWTAAAITQAGVLLSSLGVYLEGE